MEFNDKLKKSWKQEIVLYSINDLKVVLKYDIISANEDIDPKDAMPIFDNFKPTVMYYIDENDRLNEYDHFDLFGDENDESNKNHKKLKELDSTSMYDEYYEILKEFSIFPKRQNLLHLFAFKNYAQQLKDAFGSRACEYHCDSDGKTPFQLALENQSF